ncbi:hypothetical protein [Bdellovibrio bacteriovorus]|nr:hypothetical protein [Bdellovibrio bacteriovorus]
MKYLMKSFLYTLLLLLILGFASTMYLGLDNNGPDSLDTALETAQIDEEIGFEQVAAVIRTFVHRQFKIRTANENLAKYKRELARGTPGEYSKVYKDLPQEGPYATRDVHRKTHGCYKGELSINESLQQDFNTATEKIRQERASEQTQGLNKPGPMPSILANSDDLGIFQPGSHHDVIVRYSNGHPMNRPDKLPDARGFAVKILAPGTMQHNLPLHEQDSGSLNRSTSLDILSINFPTFFVNERRTALKYTEINEFFLDSAVDFGNPITGKLREGLSILSTGIGAMEIRQALWVNGSIIQSPLYQEYFSMVPSRLGPTGARRAVKYFWRPEACPGQEQDFNAEQAQQWPKWSQVRSYADIFSPRTKYTTPPFDDHLSNDYPANYLRKNLQQSLSQKDFCYGLYLQPYRDQLSTNIEDSTDIWFRSERERDEWISSVVPSPGNPLWKIYSGERASYLKRIYQKRVSPPVKAGTLRILKINDQDIVGNSKVCEDLSFNPWNGNISYHKPLGVISRLKRRVYNASRKARHLLNGFSDTSFERAR